MWEFDLRPTDLDGVGVDVAYDGVVLYRQRSGRRGVKRRQLASAPCEVRPGDGVMLESHPLDGDDRCLYQVFINQRPVPVLSHIERPAWWRRALARVTGKKTAVRYG